MKKIKILVLFVGLFSFSFLTLHIGLFSTYSKPLNRYIQSNDNTGNLKISATYTEIIINDLPGSLTNWTWAITQPWCTQGSGSSGDPYIIENAEFDSTGKNCLGIYHSRKDFIIRNCTFKNSGFTWSGLFLDNTSNGVITNNSDYNTSFMITLSNCSKNSITGNIASGNDQIGISLLSSSDNTVNGNTVCNNGFCGIYLVGTNENNDISGNIVYNNSGDGIYVDSGDFNTISGNTVYNNTGEGIYLYKSDFNDLTENEVYYNTLNGIYLEDCDNNTITENTANDNNEEGIYLYNNCINNTISGNTLNNNYRGITISTSSEYNTISGNIVNDNEEGIFLYSNCHNNTISDNTINSINIGIALESGCEDNTISGNTVKNCEYKGIKLSEGCDTNEFTDNVLYNNTLGIETGDGSDNLFYRNFFVMNDKHVNDGGTNTAWNSTTIGNYWDNHTVPDANSDGIVDLPYNISVSPLIQDYLPIAEDGAPRITINSPNSGEGFSIIAPSFDAEITDIYVISRWYTIDGGLHNITFMENSIINQSAWDALDDGPVTLKFYASDIIKNIGSAEVSIIKDTVVPVIVINSPTDGDRFGKRAPLFNITVTEINLDVMWYSFDGGVHTYIITNNTVFNQTAWTALAQEDVTITFYVRDIAGNEATEEVSVIKSVPSGLDPGVIIIIVIISVIGGVAVVAGTYIFMKKRAVPE